MLGAVAGDIIGSPFEWCNTTDRFFDMCKSHQGIIRNKKVTFHPRITDETVMTLAVARWLQDNEDWNKSSLIKIMQEMGRKYINCGFPPKFKEWILSDDPQAAYSYGNGAAMRVSPIGLVVPNLADAVKLAALSAEVSHSHPEAIKGAEAMAQAVWMAHHGRTKDDIRFAMVNDFRYDLDIPQDEMMNLLAGMVKEPVIVNGEETGGFTFRETGRIDSSCQQTVPAAIRAFLAGDCFEDCVRRAVAYGGDSDTIASMTASIAAAFYKGGVPGKITELCRTYIPGELNSQMEQFEAVCLGTRKGQQVRVPPKQDDSFMMVKLGDEKYYLVSSYRKELIESLKKKFGDDVKIVQPSEGMNMIREKSKQDKDGTYLEKPRPDCRTLYYQLGEFKTSATITGPRLETQKIREMHRKSFYEFREYAIQVKSDLQKKCGYEGEGNIHFERAYFPVIYSDSIEVWQGDIFAGAVLLDPKTGLLKLDAGGGIGPLEWYEKRTASVFESGATEDLKEALGRYCLDEGIGIKEKNWPSNIAIANEDVARSKDDVLLKEVEKAKEKKENSVKKP